MDFHPQNIWNLEQLLTSLQTHVTPRAKVTSGKAVTPWPQNTRHECALASASLGSTCAFLHPVQLTTSTAVRENPSIVLSCAAAVFRPSFCFLGLHILLFHMYDDSPACTCVPHVCLVPPEIRRWHWIPWEYSYKRL